MSDRYHEVSKRLDEWQVHGIPADATKPLIRALRHLVATARPRDTDRIIDAILGSDE